VKVVQKFGFVFESMFQKYVELYWNDVLTWT